MIQISNGYHYKSIIDINASILARKGLGGIALNTNLLSLKIGYYTIFSWKILMV